MLAYLGQQPGRTKPLNLVALCRENLPSLKLLIPPIITFQTHFSTELPVIQADAGQMRQILTNMITNAWEAIGDKPGTIQMSTGVISSKDIRNIQVVPVGWKPAHGDYAFLDVSDTGDGMGIDVRERIFDPFFSTRFIGRGLGLAVVAGIVRPHNGAIIVQSTPAQGSTFRILLPLLRCETPEEPVHCPGSERINGKRPHHSDRRGRPHAERHYEHHAAQLRLHRVHGCRRH